ncbi:hypothetical protein M4I32_13750 [Microbacterium sp. LRZ72]|uniref:hypothetical protein n=1 Tax=Microbacterium sp. LRZ72 TaxID=2942481 RepID=UPI0029AFD8C8|nr:hypothetical protein [Microbacterium sp. LRZ72]MDX2377861.1 hypothetical protein [Microbacterium sp. LRZ72]
MDDRDDIRQPQDHLPPQEERDDETEVEQPEYPDTGEPAGGSPVSPDTAAEPDAPNRHGIDSIPPRAR